MFVALTARTLERDAFESFRQAFLEDSANWPPQLVRFTMARNVDHPDEVSCFGLFDGTVEELRAGGSRADYDAQQARIDGLVASVGTDGMFEVVETLERPAATA